MPTKRLLIMGGTHEARTLANRAVESWGVHVDVITSLAGRTRDARLPKGNVRHGGFGGQTGIEAFLHDEAIDAVIDATHPFAAQISRHTARACDAAGVPHVVLDRPRWKLPDGLDVRRVVDMTAAAETIAEMQIGTVLVTVGHRDLDALSNLNNVRFLVRQIEAHEAPLPLANSERIIQRPPFDHASERALMQDQEIDALLTKESGGEATAAKLQAAAELAIPVIMIERPDPPAGDCVETVDLAFEWAVSTLGLEAG